MHPRNVGARWSILSRRSFLYSSSWKTSFTPLASVATYMPMMGLLLPAMTVTRTGFPALPLTMANWAKYMNDDSQTLNNRQRRPVISERRETNKESPTIAQVTTWRDFSRLPIGLPELRIWGGKATRNHRAEYQRGKSYVSQ